MKLDAIVPTGLIQKEEIGTKLVKHMIKKS